MAEFSYAASKDRQDSKALITTGEKNLKALDSAASLSALYAERAQNELTYGNPSPERRAQLESVIADDQKNRVEIPANKARIQAAIDEANRELAAANAGIASAASTTDDATNGLTAEPLTNNEKKNLSGSEELIDETGQVSTIRRNTETGELYDSGDLYTPKAANTDDSGSTDAEAQPGGFYGDSAQREGGNSQGPAGVSPNILDRYPNYTYGISLHYMTIKKYNDVLIRGQEYTTGDNTVLIASGGRRAADLARHPVFNHDMYFEDFKMNCVIGHNAKSRGSNAIEISFTILEPLGMTLLDKILQVAESAGIKQWDQMPFVIQIDFFANEESGRLVTPIPGTTKRICIKIIDMQIKVQPKGAIYRVTAIPQSHVALLQTNSTTPANFEVMAKKVKDFFASEGNVGEFESAVANAGRGERSQSGISESSLGELGINTAISSNQSSSKNSFKVYSYAAALNSFQEQLKKLKHQETADVYKFEFDKEIGESDIFIPDHTPMNRVAAQTDKNNNPRLDREKGMIPINAGTYIKEVINLILRASKYYRDQIEDKVSQDESTGGAIGGGTNGGSLGNSPINSHKITTKVEYGNWDNIRKMYQKTITFKVEKYIYYNTKYPEAARGLPTKWDKEYFYMYTGKNQQILDFDIDFNTMFFTVLTAMEKKYQFDRVQTDKQNPGEPDANNVTGEQQLQISRPLPVINLAQDVVQLSTMDKKYVESTDLFKSMMSNSRGDMINVKLKISGDPELIKQDDLFSSLNGSLPMDKQELFAKLEFKLPEDIDQNTGLYKINNRSIFSGLYKILTVDNQFERGQFVQILDLIRLFDQPDDRLSTNTSTGSAAAREQGQNNNAGTQALAQSGANNQLRSAISAAPALSYTNFSNTGAGEFGEELNISNFVQATGAGEFGEETPTLAAAELRNLRNQVATPADLNDFFG